MTDKTTKTNKTKTSTKTSAMKMLLYCILQLVLFLWNCFLII